MVDSFLGSKCALLIFSHLYSYRTIFLKHSYFLSRTVATSVRFLFLSRAEINPSQSLVLTQSLLVSL